MKLAERPTELTLHWSSHIRLSLNTQTVFYIRGSDSSAWQDWQEVNEQLQSSVDNAQSKKYDFVITSALIRYNVHIVVRAFLSVNTNLNANRKWCVWEDVIRRTALWLKGNFPTDCVSLCHGAWSDGEPRQTAVTSVTSWLVTWSEAHALQTPCFIFPSSFACVRPNACKAR